MVRAIATACVYLQSSDILHVLQAVTVSAYQTNTVVNEHGTAATAVLTVHYSTQLAAALRTALCKQEILGRGGAPGRYCFRFSNKTGHITVDYTIMEGAG
eukprot:15309-Heterococcus_DN1.PRE.1